MPGPFDYTQPNLPLFSFLRRQGDDLPPDEAQQNLLRTETPQQTAQTQNTSGVPAYLTPNPSDPNAPVPPSTLDNYLHMNQAVQPYKPAPRQDPQFAAYDRMAKTAAGEQWAGIDQLQKYIQDMQGQPQGFNFSPLAAYVDANDPTGKSHLLQAAQAMAPMTPEQKQQHIMDLQLKLQGDRNTLATGQLSALGKQIEMQKNAEMMQHYMNMDKSSAERTDSYVGRMNQGFDNQVQHANNEFDNHPLLVAARQRFNQINVDRHTLETATVVPKQMMSEMAAGLATAIAGAKAAGLEATRMQELSSLQGDLAKVQSYSGTPMNSLQPKQRQYLLDTFDRLSNAYQGVMADTYKALRRGRNFQYNPAANKAMDIKGISYGVQPGSFDPMATSLPAAPAQQGSSAGAPTVGTVEDGHMFMGGDPSSPQSWKPVGQ